MARQTPRRKRGYQRRDERRVEVWAERLVEPSAARMAKALLVAQHEIVEPEGGDGVPA